MMRSALVGALLAALVAACINYEADPTDAPATPTSAPTITTPPGPTPTPDPNATPTIDVRGLLNSSITLFNLASNTVTVTITIEHGESDGSNASLGSFELAPEHTTARDLLGGQEEVLPYRLDFSYPAGTGSVGGTCSVGVLAGDAYTFVAVDEGLTIMHNDEQPASVDEAIIDTSSLCMTPPLPIPSPT